jgi:hypothetical protein
MRRGTGFPAPQSRATFPSVKARSTDPSTSPADDSTPRPPNPLATAAAATGITAYAASELWGHGVVAVVVPLGAVAVVLGIEALLRVKRTRAANGGLALLGVVAGAVGILIAVISRNPLL